MIQRGKLLEWKQGKPSRHCKTTTQQSISRETAGLLYKDTESVKKHIKRTASVGSKAGY